VLELVQDQAGKSMLEALMAFTEKLLVDKESEVTHTLAMPVTSLDMEESMLKIPLVTMPS